MKRLYAILVLGLISHSLSAQTIREKIDKAHKDPANTERAAKADALLNDKKIIADTSYTNTKKKPARMNPRLFGAVGQAFGRAPKKFEAFNISKKRKLKSPCRINHSFE